jgi:hypothetical protein
MRKTHWIGLTVAGALLAAVAYPVYAHCGRCLGSAKEYLKAMQDGKTTLAAAVAAAEGAGKGTAVAAMPHKHDDGSIHVHVYTLDGDKMTLVMVDAKSGKVVKTEDAKMMDMDAKHDHKEGSKSP